MILFGNPTAVLQEHGVERSDTRVSLAALPPTGRREPQPNQTDCGRSPPPPQTHPPQRPPQPGNAEEPTRKNDGARRNDHGGDGRGRGKRGTTLTARTETPKAATSERQRARQGNQRGRREPRTSTTRNNDGQPISARVVASATVAPSQDRRRAAQRQGNYTANGTA